MHYEEVNYFSDIGWLNIICLGWLQSFANANADPDVFVDAIDKFNTDAIDKFNTDSKYQGLCTVLGG